MPPDLLSSATLLSRLPMLRMLPTMRCLPACLPPCSYAVVVSFWVTLTGVDPEDVVVRVRLGGKSAGWCCEHAAGCLLELCLRWGRPSRGGQRARCAAGAAQLPSAACLSDATDGLVGAGGSECCARGHCDQPDPRRHRPPVQHLAGWAHCAPARVCTLPSRALGLPAWLDADRAACLSHLRHLLQMMWRWCRCARWHAALSAPT